MNEFNTPIQHSTAYPDIAGSLGGQNILHGDQKGNKNLDLLIIVPRISVIYGGTQLSNGSLVLASLAHSKGYSVKVLNNNSAYKWYTDEDLLKIINRECPAIVGLSVNMLNAFNSYRLVKYLKEKLPKKIIIAGGLHTFDEPEEVSKQGFDITFVGEAEISLCKFLELIDQQKKSINPDLIRNIEFLKDLQLIPGLIINQEGELFNTGPYEILADLDELPFIDYDLLNLEDFIFTPADHHKVTTSLNFQRGCPFKCTFCKSKFMSGKIRYNSADYMVRSLKHIHEKYGRTHFDLDDPNFTLDRSRVVEFCNKMISSGLSEKISFWIQTSITASLEDEDLQLLKKAGLVRIAFGVERFSPDFRKIINKVGTLDQVFSVLRRIKKNGIKNTITILINFPNETEKSLAIESDYLMKALPYVDFYSVGYLVPVPGTAIYESEKVRPRWYLDEKINLKKISYYDLAFQIITPGVEFNLFDLSPNVLKEMRKFKEKFYIKSLAKLDTSPFLFGSIFFKIILTMDIIMARISYFLYNVSPSIENVLFWPFRMVRESGAKYFLINWFNRKEDA